jgi:hypothetical protein
MLLLGPNLIKNLTGLVGYALKGDCVVCANVKR